MTTSLLSVFTTMAGRAALTAGFFRKGCLLNGHLFRVVCQMPVDFVPCATYHCSPVRLGDAMYVDQKLAAKTKEETKSISFPLRHVEFIGCRSLSVQNNLSKGMKFKASYIDTHPEANSSIPIIVTLHGAPGSHLDFKHVINYLPKKNMRVIAPNFPGFNWTPVDSENKFGHTALEKTAFLADFLEAIKVSKIDVLVAHSAGVYTAALFCANTNIVQSLLLICPMGHRSMKSLNPLWYHQSHAKFCRIPVLRTLLLAILKLRLIIIKFPNQDAVLVSAQIETMGKLDFKQHVQAISKLAGKQFPVFMMYSENDQLVEAEISTELVKKLGGSSDLVQRYDSEAKLVQAVTNKSDRVLRGYVFKKGGHFLMKRHPEIINEAILDLYDAINKKR